MSGLREASQACCIVYKNNSDDFSAIAEMSDSVEITSPLAQSNESVQQSDVGRSPCVDSVRNKQDNAQECENPVKKMHSLTPQEKPPTSEKPWNQIIVNQIPARINHQWIDRDKFFSLFSQYGTIKDKYLCMTEKLYPPKLEKVATITYCKEEDAWRVWEDAQKKLIKYEDYVLMITLASADYCPIQNLPDICLREIFLHITSVEDKFNVESVCDRWDSIGRTSWSSVSTVKNGWMSDSWETIISRTTESIRNVRLFIAEGAEDEEDEPEDSIKRLSLIAEHLIHLESFAVTVYNTDSPSINPQLRSLVSKNNQLKRLCMWWVDLDDGFFSLLPDGMTEIRINSDQDEEQYIDSGPVNVSRFQNLQVLALFNFRIGENQLQGFEFLENLKKLTFKASNVHSSNIEKIVNFTKLEHLAIPDCQISDVVLEKILKNNKGLKHLDIGDIQDITDVSFQHVFKLPHLKVLLMKNLEEVTDTYFTSMPNLKTFECNGCTSITDVGIQQLLTPDSVLERLNISDCSITLESLKMAYEMEPHKGEFLIIYVNENMLEEWKRFVSEESSSSPSESKAVYIDKYEENIFSDSLDDEWFKIFDASV